MERFSLEDFLERFNSDEACLQEILRLKGTPESKNGNNDIRWYKIKGRPAYVSSEGKHFSPLAGTIFEKTRTPLREWFYAMFLITNTRAGISAKQLQRELGNTYKCAWRMFKLIRTLMAEDPADPLLGVVEVDETYVGGKGHHRAYAGNTEELKQVLMGLVERGGRIVVSHVPNAGKWTLLAKIQHHVAPNTPIMTDEWPAYKRLSKLGYPHAHVEHSAHEYVRGDIHTNTIEGFWSQLKNGIKAVYRHVPKKYHQ